ncbi:hypothetical protein PPSIR1_09101 [Plesiocystis pacifica SIR-1]|uniref:Cytochrome c peroxidase n=1 Tax=Plesiocystis pacifica SIR-1 TaxID=391625 RepID=A6G749_9BACT|nr:PKD domain-containing protein [Plesiocystis pacifica]EDM78325.1 hypothetical protein PPSIR1_09101 [Plesiocystis pacifica SIR-1]
MIWSFALVLAGCPARGGGEVGADEVGSESGSEDGTTTDTETDTGPGTTETETGTETDAGAETEGEALVANAGPDRYAFVDDTVELDASASTGAALYHWDFGDGTAAPEPSDSPVASHSYAEPGRYYPVLTVYDGEGSSLADSFALTITHVPSHAPRVAGSVAAEPSLDAVAVVEADASALTLVTRAVAEDEDAFELIARHPTCAGPRSLGLHAAGEGGAEAAGGWIACPEVDQIQPFDWDAGPGAARTLPWGSRPSAALRVGSRVFAALAGKGQLAVLEDGSDSFVFHDGFPDARGLALWPDGRVAVTRWRSDPDAGAGVGELRLFDPESAAVELVTLAYDPQPASDTEIGGVPTYLDQLLVSPIGDAAAVPSLQANVLHGEYINGETLTFETTVRAVVSFLVLGEADGMGQVPGAENFDLRKQFDNRGFAAAGVYSSRGDYLFAAMRGSRAIERYDTLTGSGAGTILNAGYAPSGLALSPDDRHLYVHVGLERELRVFDVTSFDALPMAIAAVATVDAEPLAAQVLRGKQLFNDSFDPRLAKHGYIACAHCHLDGESDRQTWDFTDRGEGLRNTISLLGRGGTAHGPVHWSANFDEIQDFEHDIRGPFGGLGLLSEEDWGAGTVATSLGDPKAGLSEDLDALAAYVESLDSYPRSPARTAEGELSAQAQAGAVLFASAELGCVDCHLGPALTDSAWIGPMTPLLHDVGTITEASGQRLGEPLTGLDTPTLRGLWNDPPFLHDGSAIDLSAVLGAANPDDLHGTTSSLSPAELDALVAYLLSLEGPP